MSVQAGRSGAEESQKTNSCAVKLAVPSTHCPSCNTHACKNTAATSLLLQSCFFYLKSQHGAPTWQHWQENSTSFVKWNISWILPSLFHLKPPRSGQFLVKRQGYMLCWEAHFCFKRQEKFKFNFLEKRLWLLSQCKKKKKKSLCASDIQVLFTTVKFITLSLHICLTENAKNSQERDNVPDKQSCQILRLLI